jgi:two-component system copper resistance phosphate regulon response regulator CusR
MRERANILLIEDEPKLASALQEGLQAERYDVSIARSGEEGFYLLYSGTFDLVLLDVMLPGRTGYEILAQLRKNGFGKPVMLLTARDSVEDRVHGAAAKKAAA